MNLCFGGMEEKEEEEDLVRKLCACMCVWVTVFDIIEAGCLRVSQGSRIHWKRKERSIIGNVCVDASQARSL